MVLCNGEEPCDSEDGFKENWDSQIQGEPSLSLHRMFQSAGSSETTSLINHVTQCHMPQELQNYCCQNFNTDIRVSILGKILTRNTDANKYKYCSVVVPLYHG